MGVYQARQAIRQEKVYTGTVKIDPHKFVKNTYFYTVKNIKFGHSCIGFFETTKLTIYKITSVRKSYTFQSLLKNIRLLPADSSADSFIKNNF